MKEKVLFVTPAAVTVTLFGVSRVLHPPVPASVIVTVCPATVILLTCGLDPVLGAVVNVTVPDPVPDEPELIVTQESLSAAVQVQVLVVVTVRVWLPPLEVSE